MTTNKMTIVIGVDPGDSTGVAVIEHVVSPQIVETFQGLQRPALDVVQRRLSTASTFARVNGLTFDPIVACEQYVSAKRSVHTHQSTPDRTIGAVEELARTYDARLELQSPATAKYLISRKLLRRNGLYLKAADVGKSDAHDANDALRHAMLALATCRATAFEMMIRESL